MSPKSDSTEEIVLNFVNELEEYKKLINETKGEIKSLQSNLTMEQIHDRTTNLTSKVTAMEEKLRGGVTLVSPEERETVEELYAETVGHGESAKEELGIEYDEDVGINLRSFLDMLQNSKKHPRS